MAGPSNTIDLSGYELETHVHDALEAALQAAGGGRIDATAWLAGAVQAAQRSKSAAFLLMNRLLGPIAEQLLARTQGSVDMSSSSSVTRPLRHRLELHALRLTGSMAASLNLARPFLGEPPSIWGRDYVTIGLLADDPALQELVLRHGQSIGELRQRWMDYVRKDGQRRDSEAWNAWWQAAEGSEGDDGDEDDPTASVASQPEVVVDLTEFEMSDGARRVADAARAVARGPLTTGDLLAALLDAGELRSDPAWAGDFLRHYLKDSSSASLTLASPLALSKAQARPSTSLPPLTALTPVAKRCLEEAQDIARRTSATQRIAGRHLLAALTLPLEAEPTERSSQALLARSDVDVALLRQQFYDWLRGFGDDDAAWRALLIGEQAPPRRQAGFDADSTTGPDLLNIEPEVEALATLISARDTVTPLSIGLFGDWGSGKTFFMRRLQTAVERLTREACDAPRMQRDLPFYKHVVQIEFNAWHYVEANLWASMVEHILSNLRSPNAPRNSPTEEFQRHWIEQLGFATNARQQAQDASTAAGQRVADAETAVKDAIAVHDDRARELGRLTAESVRRDFPLDDALKSVKAALAPMGLDAIGDSAADMRAALDHARGVLRHGHAVLAPLLNAPDRDARWRQLLMWLFAAPAVALLVGWAASSLDAGWKSQLVALCSGAATFLGGVATWVRKQADWVSTRLEQVDQAQKVYEEKLQAQLAATEAQKATTKQALELARQSLAQAQNAVEDAKRREIDARADVASATTTRLLGQFIQDRADSTDYRKHLGVLAIVRQDFERLSRLIEEENWRLSAGPDEATRKRIATMDEETLHADRRINRIVLYIDDLDRCPPEKVVEVLQAVHLLLAFPLFTVVVGVDARWVSRSLEARYRHLLDGGVQEGAEAAAQVYGSARSEDYLEKIFQIPLWLRPMGPSDAQRMVRGLLRESAPGPGTGAETARDSAKIDEPALASPPAPLGDIPEPSSANAPPAMPDARRADGKDAVDPLPPPIHAAASSALAAERLRIGEFERAIMDRLAPLLGRSPRALKRFVNVYRLIKAGLNQAELVRFAPAETSGPVPCAAVLLLLAIDTGLPALSPLLNDRLRQPEQGRFSTLVASLAETAPSHGGDWARLKRWADANKEWLDGGDLPLLAEWVPRVSRYSFQGSGA